MTSPTRCSSSWTIAWQARSRSPSRTSKASPSPAYGIPQGARRSTSLAGPRARTWPRGRSSTPSRTSWSSSPQAAASPSSGRSPRELPTRPHHHPLEGVEPSHIVIETPTATATPWSAPFARLPGIASSVLPRPALFPPWTAGHEPSGAATGRAAASGTSRSRASSAVRSTMPVADWADERRLEPGHPLGYHPYAKSDSDNPDGGSGYRWGGGASAGQGEAAHASADGGADVDRRAVDPDSDGGQCRHDGEEPVLLRDNGQSHREAERGHGDDGDRERVAGRGEHRNSGRDADGTDHVGGPRALSPDETGDRAGAGHLPASVGEHGHDDPVASGLQDGRQVGDHHKGRGQDGDGADDDAEDPAVGQSPDPSAQPHYWRMGRRQEAHRERRDDREDDQDPHRRPPPPSLANQDPEGQAGDERGRAAAGHDGERPGSLVVIAEDSGRAVGSGLVSGSAEGGEDPAGGYGGEVSACGLDDHPADEHAHPSDEQAAAVPTASEGGDARGADGVDEGEERGELAHRTGRDVQRPRHLRQEAGQHERVGAEGEGPDGQHDAVGAAQRRPPGSRRRRGGHSLGFSGRGHHDAFSTKCARSSISARCDDSQPRSGRVIALDAGASVATSPASQPKCASACSMGTARTGTSHSAPILAANARSEIPSSPTPCRTLPAGACSRASR